MLNKGGNSKGIIARKPLTYDQAKALAAHEDLAVRRELALREDLKPEILYFLAEDPNPEVRRCIAANRATPPKADLLLASDSDDGVRLDLAGKIARLAPGLSADEQDKLRQMTYEVLEILARDQIVRVRQILAETLKDVANAPPDLIRGLALDSEISVAGPILEFSPVLTDQDLLEIITRSPITGALRAISRRSTVRPAVADAISNSDDVEAISALLANPSAQIREETLNILVERAIDIEEWHESLVRRPCLSQKAATRLARIVADNLLGILEKRRDLDQNTMDAVADVVRKKVSQASQAETARPQDEEADPLAAAKAMVLSGALTEEVIAKALASGDRDFVSAALAVLTDLPLAAVKKVVTNRSAKGTVALAWRARLSPGLATELQTKLSRVPNSEVMRPRDGSFPLPESDMAWQIELFASMAAS